MSRSHGLLGSALPRDHENARREIAPLRCARAYLVRDARQVCRNEEIEVSGSVVAEAVLLDLELVRRQQSGQCREVASVVRRRKAANPHDLRLEEIEEAAGQPVRKRAVDHRERSKSTRRQMYEHAAGLAIVPDL